ncbi:31.7 kDa protein in traX-finO intergenic region [Purpureocillium lavendulum]|uniref:31.7 kDa protein in traX-finO intergenic region n=1 Tax=Purpureocillium lavendulum TaxID=1247861 RepID=A0AB34FXS8_9HYPO|nr:31.7 kDa protein in traX-finO intergenic region [Purpureocillium lavendulum]
MPTSPRDVEFQTLDGLTIRGALYAAPTRGPAAIITPGFNCVKEMFVPEVAEQFQLAGITALIYDPRNLGLSDGEPRNEVDPMKQVSDYSDALTYLRTLPEVDPDKIIFWGQSFAGCVALCAGALDKRARMVVSICPLLDFELTPEKFPKVLAKKDGVNPAGLGIGADKEEFDYMVNAKKYGAARHENRTTLQTYYKLIMWQPYGIMKYMHQTPVLMVIPELDQISPPEQQHSLFSTFPGPKKAHVSIGKGHLNVLSGPEFPDLIKMQVDFIQDILAGNTERYITNGYTNGTHENYKGDWAAM